MFSALGCISVATSVAYVQSYVCPMKEYIYVCMYDFGPQFMPCFYKNLFGLILVLNFCFPGLFSFLHRSRCDILPKNKYFFQLNFVFKNNINKTGKGKPNFVSDKLIQIGNVYIISKYCHCLVSCLYVNGWGNHSLVDISGRS